MIATRLSNRKVAVIGAGLAGIAAAHKLLQHGYQVCVFEAAAQAGGRARGVAHASHLLDNGQHLCIGAYQDTMHLLQAADLDAEHVFMRLPLALHMHHPSHNGAQCMSLVTPTWLPAPLHLLWGLLNARGLDWHSKWRAIGWMTQLKKQAFTLASDCTVEALLTQGKQTVLAIQTLWEPLCLAALNTPIDVASAQVFLNVLRDSFQHRRQDSDFLVLRSDLSSALVEPLLRRIAILGGEVRLRSTVSAIEATQQTCTLTTPQGSQAFDAVVVAVGPHQLKTIAGISVAPTLAYQPITTVYLQYDADLHLPYPIMGLCHGLAQWVFDRGQCCGQAGLLAVVISAHPPLTSDKPALIAQCIAELNLALSQYHITLSSSPDWTQVITEKRATFSCTPALDRPTTLTDNPRLFMAGDYVAGPYPATIEGAIRSGNAAAQAIIDLH